MVTASCDWSDNEEKLESAPVDKQNNDNCNEVSDSKSDSDDKSEENLFDVDISEEVEATPKISINAKMVQAMKKLQASYNNDANKILKQAA